jgi:hypothetical protein
VRPLLIDRQVVENCYGCDMPFFTGLGTKDNVPRFLRWNGAPSARSAISKRAALQHVVCHVARMSSAALQHVVCHVARMSSAALQHVLCRVAACRLPRGTLQASCGTATCRSARRSYSSKTFGRKRQSPMTSD